MLVVSNMLFVTVLVMVYLRLDSNEQVYLLRLDPNLLVSVSNIFLVTVLCVVYPAIGFQSASLPAAIGSQSARTR